MRPRAAALLTAPTPTPPQAQPKPQRAQTTSTMNVGTVPRSALAGEPAAQGAEEKLPWRASIDDISRVSEAISERKQYEANR